MYHKLPSKVFSEVLCWIHELSNHCRVKLPVILLKKGVNCTYNCVIYMALWVNVLNANRCPKKFIVWFYMKDTLYFHWIWSFFQQENHNFYISCFPSYIDPLHSKNKFIPVTGLVTTLWYRSVSAKTAHCCNRAVTQVCIQCCEDTAVYSSVYTGVLQGLKFLHVTVPVVHDCIQCCEHRPVAGYEIFASLV